MKRLYRPIGYRHLAVLAAVLIFVNVSAAAGDVIDDANSGIAAISQGNYPLAIQVLTRVLETESPSLTRGDRGVIFFNRGLAQQSLSNLDGAIEDYGRAIEIGAEDSFSFFNRGTAYEAQGRFECARRDFARAVELNPNRPAFAERLEAVRTRSGGDIGACQDITVVADAVQAEVEPVRPVPPAGSPDPMAEAVVDERTSPVADAGRQTVAQAETAGQETMVAAAEPAPVRPREPHQAPTNPVPDPIIQDQPQTPQASEPAAQQTPMGDLQEAQMASRPPDATPKIIVPTPVVRTPKPGAAGGPAVNQGAGGGIAKRPSAAPSGESLLAQAPMPVGDVAAASPPGPALGLQPLQILEAGTLTVNFGDDQSPFARDGECDDARFAGAGMAVTQLLKADLFHDAEDCRNLYMSGLVRLRR